MEREVRRTRKRGKQVAKSEDEQNRNFGCPVSVIPNYIWFEIMLMLSVRELLICRCVCQTWRTIIAGIEFSKKYFTKSELHALIQPLSDAHHVSRSLYLVEPPYFELNFERQHSSSSADHLKSIKLETQLKLPLCNSDLQLKTESRVKESTKQKHPSKLRAKDNRFSIANSCRGLFCLFNPYKTEQVVVYNPITGEYINLPTRNRDDEDPEWRVECALGFSPQDNQYKVLRMFDQKAYQFTYDPITWETVWTGSVAEIHTLGTSSWRMIGNAPSPHHRLGCATYLEGAIHWLYFDNRRVDYIISFNFLSEVFRSIPPPDYDNHMIDLRWYRNITLGELRGCLCMCFPSDREISLWVMKDYGVQGSWTKEFCLTLTNTPSSMVWKTDSYKPICVISNGRVLLFQPTSKGLFCFEPNGKDFKFLQLCGLKSDYEVRTYFPSFISLKECIVGEDLEVLNINSRVVGFKLPRKKKTLSLDEKLLIRTI